jgi:acyl-CoA reductase-like NAD-dependent aldehyde dehydrogenase
LMSGHTPDHTLTRHASRRRCSKAEADAALAAAQKAAPGWGSMPIDERAKHIANYAAKLKEHASEIKALLVAETGKVTSNAEYDFNMLIDCLPYHVEEVRRSYGAVVPSPDNSALSYTKHSPVGVVVAVLTWNFPLLNLGYKLGPILASGCTCVAAGPPPLLSPQSVRARVFCAAATQHRPSTTAPTAGRPAPPVARPAASSSRPR